MLSTNVVICRCTQATIRMGEAPARVLPLDRRPPDERYLGDRKFIFEVENVRLDDVTRLTEKRGTQLAGEHAISRRFDIAPACRVRYRARHSQMRVQDSRCPAVAVFSHCCALFRAHCSSRTRFLLRARMELNAHLGACDSVRGIFAFHTRANATRGEKSRERERDRRVSQYRRYTMLALYNKYRQCPVVLRKKRGEIKLRFRNTPAN